MTSLDQIVLPLAESRALAEKVKLDTALSWYEDTQGKQKPVVVTRDFFINQRYKQTGAPVLSELLDAIRAKVKLMSGEIEVILGRDESEAEASCAALRINGGYARNLLLGSTDILAAYALLREVSK